MKRRIILVPLIILTLSSCATLYMSNWTSYDASYSISLSRVERPSKASTRYGQQKIESITDPKYKYIFEDDLVKVLWLANGRSIFFSIQNKTDHSIKIPWDEAAYIDTNGSSHRVMHSGVKYTDRANPQAPSIIARKASIEDIVFPTDYVYWKERTPVFSACWEEKPLLANHDFFEGKYVQSQYSSFEAFEQEAKSNVGKSFQVLMPLQIEDVVNDYIFTFVIDSVICTQKTERR
jgi:hypothetical protein